MIKFTEHPVKEQLSQDYKIVCAGQEITPYAVRVSAMPYNIDWPGHQRTLDQTEMASVVSFECDGEVEMEVTVAWDFEEVVVRPLSKGVKVEREGRVCRFTLPACGQYTLETDGQSKALHIFADPVIEFSGEGNVIRYPAGIHHEDLVIDSNTTVILDRGAVLFGSITAYGAENVNILGYGIIDGSLEKRETLMAMFPYDYKKELPRDKGEFMAYLKDNGILNGCIRLYRCKNALVQGVTMNDSATFNLIPADCDNVVIDNVKTIGMWKYNSDGIDIFNSSNIVVKNTFLRNFDDCLVIKGMPGWDTRNNENIIVENCVIWCDWGRALEIGAETNAPEYRNIIFQNCDLIHSSYAYMDVQHHNRAHIHNIEFNDIRAEYSKHHLGYAYHINKNEPYTNSHIQPTLIDIPLMNDGRYSEDGLMGDARNISYKNIQVYADCDPSEIKISFSGADDEHDIRGIRISGYYVNGESATPNIETNEFVHDITVE